MSTSPTEPELEITVTMTEHEVAAICLTIAKGVFDHIIDFGVGYASICKFIDAHPARDRIEAATKEFRERLDRGDFPHTN